MAVNAALSHTCAAILGEECSVVDLEATGDLGIVYGAVCITRTQVTYCKEIPLALMISSSSMHHSHVYLPLLMGHNYLCIVSSSIIYPHAS